MADKNVDLSIKIGVNDKASGQIKQLESRIIRFVGAVSAALASVKLIAFPATEAAKFERSMKDVQKTTGFANYEIKQLTASLKEMSTELSVNADDLADIAAVAGQLGLGDAGLQAIESFTASVARASVTLGITAEEAANAGATIANIFNIDVGNVERIFSSVNELSNTSVAAGQDLIDIVKRVGNTADLEADKVVALAAYVKELGVPNEQAGTFLVKAFSNMLAEGKKFAEAMGVTQNEWIASVKQDAVAAFQDITKKLFEMENGVRELYTKELFGSGRLFSAANKAIADVANGQASLVKFLDSSNRAFVEGTSSIEEYQTIVEATSEQYTILLNKLNVIGISIGDKLLPVIKSVIVELQSFLDSDAAQLFFDNLAESLVKLITNIREFVKWVSDLNIAWNNVLQGIKLFLEYEVAKTLFSISAGIAASITKVNAYAAAWGRASAAQNAATASLASGSAVSGTTSSISSLIPIVATFTGQIKKSQQAFAESRAEAIRLYQTELDAIAIEKNKAVLIQQSAAARATEQQIAIQNMRLYREKIMEQTRLEKQRAIEEAAGNKKIIADIEANWAKRNLWAKNYYNFIRREETKLAAVRKASAAAGLGVAAAGTAAQQKQQAALKALNASYIAQSKNIGLINGLLASAVGIASRLGGLLLNVGKTLLTFAGGWVGLAITGVILFWDEIKGLLGFITKEEENAKIEAAAAAKQLQKTKDEADQAAQRAKEIADQISSTYRTNENLDLGSLIQTSDNATVVSSMKEVVNQFSLMTNAANNAKEAISGYDTLAANAFDQLARAQVDLVAAENAYNQERRRINESQNIYFDENTDKLHMLGSEYEAQKAQIVEYEKAVDKANATLASQETLLSDMESALSGLASGSFGNIFDDLTISYGEMQGQTVGLVEQLQKAQAEAKDAERVFDDLVASGAGRLQIGDQQVRVNEAKDQVEELTGTLDVLRKRIGQVRKELSPAQREVVKFIDSLTNEGKQGFAAYADTIRQAVQENKNYIETLTDNADVIVAQASAWKQVQKEIKTSSAEILGFRSNAKGVLDNTNSEVRSLISSINDFRAEIRKTFADTKFEISLKVDDKENKLQKRLEEDITWVENYYNKRIENATSSISKKRLEQWKQESIEIRKNIASKKQAILEEERLRAILDRTAENYAKYAKAAQDAAKKALETGNKEDAAAALFNKELAQDELKSYMDTAKKIINTTYKDITGKDRQLISPKGLDEFEKRYAEMAANLATITPNINQDAFDAFDKAAKPLEQALSSADAQVKKFSSQLDVLKNTYKGFTEVVEQSSNNFKELFPQLDSLIDPLREKLSGAVSGALSSQDIDFTGIAANFSKGLLEGVRSATSGSEFQNAISSATTFEFSSKSVEKLREDIVFAIQNTNIEVPPGLIPPTDVDINLNVQQEEIDNFKKKIGDINGIQVYVDLVANKVVLPSGTAEGISNSSVSLPKFSKGGEVNGPGTTTSDSILGWLSKKEYVIDAATTGFFGSSFFRALQLIAKRGRGPARFKSGLPAFANGGFVGDAVSRIGTKEKIAEFMLDGKRYAFSSSEETINEFGRAVKALSTKRSRVR